MLDSLSNDRNINYRPDELAMEDKESHGTVSEICIEEAFEIRDVLEKLLKKGKISRSIGTICREPLNDVRNLAFLVEDEAEVLHTVKEKLEEIRAMLKGSVKTDENLLLEPHQTQNRKREINLKSHQLPLRQKKKLFTKRFGESSYIKEKASNIDMIEALDFKKYWEEIPELVLNEKDQGDKAESVSSNEHKPDNGTG